MRKYDLISAASSKSLNISREELEKLYAEGRTQTEMAQHFGCSIPTIGNYMRKYDLISATSKLYMSREHLEALCAEGLTITEMAERLGCSPTTAYKYIHKYGLATRSSKLNISREELEKLYVQELTPKEMAEHFGCHPITIRKYMRQYGFISDSDTKTRSRFNISRKELEALNAEGLTPTKIAQRFGCSKNTIRRFLDKYDLIINEDPPKFELNREKLQALCDEGLSQTQIAERIGCCQGTISNYLRKYGLVTRFQAIYNRRFDVISRDELKRLYAEGLTVKQIAERFGYSPSSIAKLMRKYGLAIRTFGDYKRIDISREKLEKLYAEGLTTEEIGQRLGYSQSIVYNRMREYGIPLRSAAESRRIKKSREQS